MRIEVVLPLPLGPRKPRISPRFTRSDKSFTTSLSPKCLFSPRTSIAQTASGLALIAGSLQTDRDRLPGTQPRRVLDRGARLDQEHQLRARFVAIDDGGSEL